MNRSQQSGFSRIKQSVSSFWASLTNPTKYLIYIIFGIQIVMLVFLYNIKISLLYDRLFYCLSNFSYFVTYKYYEFYRLFTSILVEELSFDGILFIPFSIYMIGRVESKDGCTLLFYRIIIINILSNLLFTLLSSLLVYSDPDQYYGLSIQGMSTICSVFLWMELLSNNELRTRLRSNMGLMIAVGIFIMFSLLSIKGIGTVLIVLLCYYVPSFYSPPRRVIQFIIPFPLFKYLVQEDMKRSVIETKAKPQKQTQGPRIITINHVASEMQNPEYPQPSEPIQEKSEKPSRFKGTGRILYLLV